MKEKRKNKNKKQKIKKKTNKDRKEEGATEGIVQGWEQNDFVVHLNYVFSNYYVKLLYV